jgi:hypothetical protein
VNLSVIPPHTPLAEMIGGKVKGSDNDQDDGNIDQNEFKVLPHCSPH